MYYIKIFCLSYLKKTILSPGYQSQVFSSLNNKTLTANTVVILKTVLLDDSHDEDEIRYLPSNLSHLTAEVVKSVKIECPQENIVQVRN